jgi:hypothetical protein
MQQIPPQLGNTHSKRALSRPSIGTSTAGELDDEFVRRLVLRMPVVFFGLIVRDVLRDQQSLRA